MAKVTKTPKSCQQQKCQWQRVQQGTPIPKDVVYFDGRHFLCCKNKQIKIMGQINLVYMREAVKQMKRKATRNNCN